jgi:hypothetical protein
LKRLTQANKQSMPVHKVYFAIALGVVIMGFLLLCLWSPWHQVFPNRSHPIVVLPRAPIWSHPDLPGASINLGQLLLEAAIIVLVAGLIIKIGRGTRSRIVPPKKT